MPATPRPLADSHDHKRPEHRAELADEIRAVGGNADAFLKELDAHRLHVDNLIDRFITQTEHEYIKFAEQLREKYTSLAGRPGLGDNPGSRRRNLSETVIPENSGEDQSPGSSPVGATLASAGRAGPAEPVAATQSATVDAGRPLEAPASDTQDVRINAGRPLEAPASDTQDVRINAGRPLEAPASDTQDVRINATPAEDVRSAKESHAAPALSQRRSSAIRTSGSSPRLPRKKRVSLVVGDEVVAPSDLIHGSLPMGVMSGDPVRVGILSSLRKNAGNGNGFRKPLTLDVKSKIITDKENKDQDEFAMDSPFLMDEEPSYPPMIDDDKEDLEASADEVEDDVTLSAPKMEILSSSPALAIPRRAQQMPTARRQTFSLQMTPTVIQPVRAGFSIPSARFDPTGSPEQFEAVPVKDDGLMFGSLTRAEPGSFRGGSLGVSMIGAQLQDLYLSSDRKSKAV